MIDPPKDLMGMAYDVHDKTVGFTRFAKIYHIAEAINAERERCIQEIRRAIADIADGETVKNRLQQLIDDVSTEAGKAALEGGE